MKDKEKTGEIYESNGDYGIYRYVGGRKVFIKLGQSLSEAMENSQNYPKYEGKLEDNITDKWKKDIQTSKERISKRKNVCIGKDGKEYTRENAILDSNHNFLEMKNAQWIKENVIGDIALQPSIKEPKGIPSADLICTSKCKYLKEQTIEMKAIDATGTSPNGVSGAIKKGKKQSENVFVDISEYKYSDETAVKQVRSAFRNTSWLMVVILMRDGKLVGIYKRR